MTTLWVVVAVVGWIAVLIVGRELLVARHALSKLNEESDDEENLSLIHI